MFKFNKKQEKDKTKLRGQIIELLSNRIIIVGVLLMVLFCLLIYRLFVLQIIQGDEHLANFNYKIKKTIEISGARGNIYDCNGKTLAYNQLAYTVTLENTDETSRIARERTNANGENGQKVTENDVKNEEIYKLIREMTAAGKSVIVVSSELQELLRVCDNIHVMYDGRQVMEVNKVNFNADQILHASVVGRSAS